MNADKISYTVPRPEHPRPDFERADWLNLNGEWMFEIDNGDSGEERGLAASESLSGKILVPFCPESELSGVGNKDFMNAVWYKRKFSIPTEWNDKRVILHFEACDYHTTVFVNGAVAGKHTGGYTPFSFDITDLLSADGGDNVLTVCARDNTRSHTVPSGKQSDRFGSWGCFYTRTTGIWQTVWLEAVDPSHIVRFEYTCDIESPALYIKAALSESGVGCRFAAEAFYKGRSVGKTSVSACGRSIVAMLPLSERHLWECGKGELYDIVLTLEDENTGKQCDCVKGYFGLRSVALKDGKFLLNGKSVFQRLVLDQGFYPDGIYTAPDEAALVNDIEQSMALGFNGARLHEKVFEARFIYHCDRLGYMVWGEFPDWSLDFDTEESASAVICQMTEEILRDINHPSIVGWCPLNELWSHRKYDKERINRVTAAVRALDPSRLLIDCSGGIHADLGDIWDIHCYTQDPAEFRKQYFGDAVYESFPDDQKYDGKPLFMSEYGGIAWAEDKSGWGYGIAPGNIEEFYSRYEGLTDVLLEDPRYFGFCYTQLYDVEQEQNGLMTYDRRHKFDVKRIHGYNTKKAAIEE